MFHKWGYFETSDCHEDGRSVRLGYTVFCLVSHSANNHSFQGQATKSDGEPASSAAAPKPQKQQNKLVVTVGLEEDQEEEDKEQDPLVEMGDNDDIPDVSWVEQT